MTAGPEAVRAARSEWRRSQIVDAATTLLSSQGYHQMSVNELAREAGISVGTVYQYVKNKQDILLLVMRDILEAYRHNVPRAMEGFDDPLDRLSSGFGAYCRVVDSRRAGTILAYRESSTLAKEALDEMKSLEEETTGLLVTCLRECVEAGILHEHDSDTLAWDLMMLAHMWSLKHWHFGSRMSIDEYARLQFAVVVSAIIHQEVTTRYEYLARPLHRLR